MNELEQAESTLRQLQERKKFLSEELAKAEEAIPYYKELVEEEKFMLRDAKGMLIGDDGKTYLPNTPAIRLSQWKSVKHEALIEDSELTRKIARHMDEVKRLRLRNN